MESIDLFNKSREDAVSRLAEIIKAIENHVANYNILIGQKVEAEHNISVIETAINNLKPVANVIDVVAPGED